jgi:hypothetical protein
MAHIQNYTYILRNIKTSPFFLLSSEKLMLGKLVFSQRKRRKWPILIYVGIQNLEVIYEEQLMAHIQNHTYTTSKHTNFTIIPLILREIDDEITRFQPAKIQKMNNFFMTLEFKILRLFLKNKWWLTSRTKQNTTLKHKNFTIFPIILREIDANKTRFQPEKTQKKTNFTWRLNLNFWCYIW